ncbi:hypothetical protein [Niabella beijingensis]|uniref:hypothetical protein n=1 Tax=Niabella beijingensis TaxID=2872700 RepID=UPI001CBC9566|nr:hypothetical protein [Niabella beijingensis]MBZ4190447.1 hypothetical protein [Niabella beijingensis]
MSIYKHLKPSEGNKNIGKSNSNVLNVYLDNNIVVSVENGEYSLNELKTLLPNKEINLFYSAAHLYEAESFPGNLILSRETFLNRRFQTIRNLFKNNYLYLDLNGNIVRRLVEDPQNVYNTITEIPSAITAMKGFMNFISKELKEQIRDSLGIEVHKLNNYTEENVLEHLNAKLPGLGMDISFMELIEMSINCHPDGSTFGLHNRIAAIFELLDMLGYWKDKETNTSNYARLWDADHCFNASYCDYFVSNDKRTRNKAKVVYRIYKAETKVISTSLNN